VPAERTLALVADRADPSGTVPLDDLPGAGGRFDLVARFVNAALLTSHGIREGTDAVALFTRATPDPVAVRVRAGEVTGLRPDERSTAARLNAALEATAMPVWQAVDEGVEVRAVDLATLVEEATGPLVHLHEDGEPLAGLAAAGGTFVLGDQDGLAAEHQRVLARAGAREVSVGPVALQADQVAGVVHNRLDRVRRATAEGARDG
jgi:tRNA (pseudouridine54-N1)-methyltransferase